MSRGSFQQYLRKAVSGEVMGTGAALTRFGLGLLEPVYQLLLTLNRALTRRRILPKPIYSIGNLIVGGTGKTPAVVWLARLIKEQGRHPAILTRGYRGEGNSVCFTHLTPGVSPELVGDEPCMLAKMLPGTLICTGRDRYQAGLAALKADPAIDCFILDDGFQHWRLARQLDIVMLDAANPFGNGHLIPRGLLREPPSALERADIILLSRAEGPFPYDLKLKLAPHTKAVTGVARVVPPSLVTFAEWQDGKTGLPAAVLKGNNVALLTAIGAPGQFKASLERLGAVVGYEAFFPDHHFWNSAEIEAVLNEAQAAGAQTVITTAKDAVKLERFYGGIPGLAEQLRILTLEFLVDDKEVLTTIQRKI
jgi:tetraacyldisaccharide 4'-kinase